jgi:hypothetical protein
VDPAYAPRNSRCGVCKRVADPSEVTAIQFDLEAPRGAAIDYLRSVGIGSGESALRSMLGTHKRHVQAFMERGAVMAPGEVMDGLSKIPDLRPTTWIELQQAGMDLGASAHDILKTRIALMSDEDLIAVARLGQTAAASRAVLQMKGALKNAEDIARLAAGFVDE